MDSSSGLSASDVLALTRDNNYNSEGFNFWWVIVFLIVAGMFGGNGFFGNNSELADEFVKRDIFNTNQNVSNTASDTQRDVLNNKYDLAVQTLNNKYDLATQTLENRYTTQLGLQQLQAQNQNCCCETQKEILQSRYDNSLGQAGITKDMLLGNQNLQSKMSECCCDIKTAIHSEGEATRALITDNTIQDLRDRLTLANNTIATQTLANNVVNQVRPFPQPAYITASPYQSYYTGLYGNYGVSTVV